MLSDSSRDKWGLYLLSLLGDYGKHLWPPKLFIYSISCSLFSRGVYDGPVPSYTPLRKVTKNERGLFSNFPRLGSDFLHLPESYWWKTKNGRGLVTFRQVKHTYYCLTKTPALRSAQSCSIWEKRDCYTRVFLVKTFFAIPILDLKSLLLSSDTWIWLLLNVLILYIF